MVCQDSMARRLAWGLGCDEREGAGGEFSLLRPQPPLPHPNLCPHRERLVAAVLWERRAPAGCR